MPDPRAPRRARLVLWAWAIASLFALAYVGLVFLASVPAEATNDAAAGLEHGARVIIMPVEDAAGSVTPLADANATRVLGARGDVIAFTPGADGTPRSLLPFTPGPREFARALAFVHPAPNATGNVTWHAPALNASNVTLVNLTGVPVVNASTGRVDAVNATVNLSAFRAEPGFLVKPDAAPADAVTFVPALAVTGKIERPVHALALWGALVFSALGAALPLFAIVLTHNARGARGLPASARAAGACRECQGPLDAALAFCPRCGAER